MSAHNTPLSFTEAAQTDIDNLLAYTLATWGRKQMKAYTAKLKAAFQALTKNPNAGYKRGEYMVFRAEHHRIFYRLEPSSIKVIRILHERMDADKHMP